ANCAATAGELNKIVESSDDLASARDTLIDQISESERAHRPAANGNHLSFNNPAFLSRSIEDALYCRMAGSEPKGPARELASRSLLELGEMNLLSMGQRVSGSRTERARQILEARPTMFGGPVRMEGGGQLTTSDFPGI